MNLKVNVLSVFSRCSCFTIFQFVSEYDNFFHIYLFVWYAHKNRLEIHENNIKTQNENNRMIIIFISYKFDDSSCTFNNTTSVPMNSNCLCLCTYLYDFKSETTLEGVSLNGMVIN